MSKDFKRKSKNAYCGQTGRGSCIHPVTHSSIQVSLSEYVSGLYGLQSILSDFLQMHVWTVRARMVVPVSITMHQELSPAVVLQDIPVIPAAIQKVNQVMTILINSRSSQRACKMLNYTNLASLPEKKNEELCQIFDIR